VVALQSTNLKACTRTGSKLLLGYQPDCKATDATRATILCDRDPTLNALHCAALHRCMARSRWGEEAEWCYCVVGWWELADLHLHPHAGPLPVGRWLHNYMSVGEMRRGWRKAYRTINPSIVRKTCIVP
jgi:hypothetical protein